MRCLQNNSRARPVSVRPAKLMPAVPFATLNCVSKTLSKALIPTLSV